MLAAFCLGLLWLAYVYGGYVALLACVKRRQRLHTAMRIDYTPSVSVLIAARNEARDIGWKIEQTLAWDYPPERLQILVVSDASDDATDEIVRRYVAERVTLIRMELHGGKARALNCLVQQAHSELLFFTDANSHIGPYALRLMVRHFADARIGCVTGSQDPLDNDESPLGGGARVYWTYESLLKRLENRVGSVLVCDGAIFRLRAHLFAPLDPELANDLELPMRAGAAGYWVVHEREAKVVERETTSPLEEFNRRRRICSQGVLAMVRLAGTLRGLRGWQFISHKFLRWLSLVPMLIVLVSSAALAPGSTVFAAIFALQMLFYGLAAVGFAAVLGRWPMPCLCALPFYTLLSVVGALVGVMECVGGKRFDVWEIPTMSRGPLKATLRRSI